jgi:antitoxin PrlF
MHYDAKITSKGQLTLPVEIRRRLGVGPGAVLRFEIGDEGVTVSTPPSLEDLRGIIDLGRPVSQDEIDRWVRAARGAIGGADA